MVTRLRNQTVHSNKEFLDKVSLFETQICGSLGTKYCSLGESLDLMDSLTFLEKRILARDANGQVTETPAQMFRCERNVRAYCDRGGETLTIL